MESLQIRPDINDRINEIYKISRDDKKTNDEKITGNQNKMSAIGEESDVSYNEYKSENIFRQGLWWLLYK